MFSRRARSSCTKLLEIEAELVPVILSTCPRLSLSYGTVSSGTLRCILTLRACHSPALLQQTCSFTVLTSFFDSSKVVAIAYRHGGPFG